MVKTAVGELDLRRSVLGDLTLIVLQGVRRSPKTQCD